MKAESDLKGYFAEAKSWNADQIRSAAILYLEAYLWRSEGPRAATDEDNLNNNGFCFFKDPDGNGWGIQEINTRP